MTLWRCAWLSYLTVAAVFAVMLSTSEEWQGAAREHPERWASALRFFALVAFGCLWPAFAVIWLFV